MVLAAPEKNVAIVDPTFSYCFHLIGFCLAYMYVDLDWVIFMWHKEQDLCKRNMATSKPNKQDEYVL